MRATEYERTLIENNIAIWSKTLDATGMPLLSPREIFKIREIKNFKLQDLFLSSVVETNRKRAEQDKQNREQATFQAQQESAKQSKQMEAEMQREKLSSDKEMKEYEALQDMKVEIVTGLMQIAAKGPEAQMPAWVGPILQQLVPNIIIPIAQENQQMQNAIVAEQQQQEQQEQVQEQLQQMSPEEQQQFMAQQQMQ